MEFSTIHYALSLLILVVNVCLFIAIKFNDLKHLDLSVKELKATVEKTGDKLDSLSERISCMEGKISVSLKGKIVRKRR